MKNNPLKFLFSVLLFTLFFCFCGLCQAQEAGEVPLRPGIGSNHSLSVTLMGAEYSYEQRLVNKFSVISRAGAVAPEITIQNTSESLYIWYPVNLAVALEPRFYTNIDRRARLHKELDNNAADFVSIRVQYFFKPKNSRLRPCMASGAQSANTSYTNSTQEQDSQSTPA